MIINTNLFNINSPEGKNVLIYNLITFDSIEHVEGTRLLAEFNTLSKKEEKDFSDFFYKYGYGILDTEDYGDCITYQKKQ